MEQRDKRALRALEQQCNNKRIPQSTSYSINGEQHRGPAMRYYHRWLHELKKQ